MTNEQIDELIAQLAAYQALLVQEQARVLDYQIRLQRMRKSQG